MNIALDIDGCLANFHYSFSEVANKLFGTPIIKEINDVKKYDWTDWNILTKEQCRLTWKKIDKDVENFWLNANSLVDELIFKRLEILEKGNNNIFFVTLRRDTAGMNVLQQTNLWIRKHSNLKHFCTIPTEKKGKILDGIKAKYFLDDSPEQVIEASIEAPKCKSFLLVRPYNAYAIEFINKSHKFKNIGIVYSVDEFLDIVEKG